MQKILIANRGEIAVRIIKTARAMGYRSVAVYSDADAGSLHVRQADQAVCIGRAPASQSYLVADKIIEAARKTGADAIHPGYGFLSENSDFARRCVSEGLVFIGPDAAAIELMGSKRLSKIAMLEAGAPCIPGYQGADQDDETLIAKAQEIGFPIMVKASAGGGGRGMRLVHELSELAEHIQSARSEALNAFGSGELILEKAVSDPRHIEIQVFADDHGNAVHLFERDCSIQRRHQKVVEEAPSPFVDEDLRARMGAAAVNIARSCNYKGAGTVEFLVDKDRNFYFLEMNTRLQVEHPVTEMITGLDLVAWQLMVAAGEALPLSQEEINLKGHAIEVRLYAEEPRKNFMPQTGMILRWAYPQRQGVRVDHGVEEGQEISPHYDPMIAKIIAFGDNRQTALRRLASAVEDMELLGVNNNGNLLKNILRHPVLVSGGATTSFIDKHFTDDSSMQDIALPVSVIGKAALAYYLSGAQQQASWSQSAIQLHVYKLDYDGHVHEVRLSCRDSVFNISVGGENQEFTVVSALAGCCILVAGGVRSRFIFVTDLARLYLQDDSGHYIFDNVTQRPAASGGAGGGEIKAPMDGAIIDVKVSVGDRAAEGQTLIVLEAMKMEHHLKAGITGIVESISVSVNQQVKTKQVLAVISEDNQS